MHHKSLLLSVVLNYICVHVCVHMEAHCMILLMSAPVQTIMLVPLRHVVCIQIFELLLRPSLHHPLIKWQYTPASFISVAFVTSAVMCSSNNKNQCVAQQKLCSVQFQTPLHLKIKQAPEDENFPISYLNIHGNLHEVCI